MGTGMHPSSIAPASKVVASLHGLQRGVMGLGEVAFTHAAATCVQQVHNHVSPHHHIAHM